MQLQGVTIALRQRMPWEATDLGIALVRAHAKRIFAAWCLVTLPVFALVNALGLAIDAYWAATLAMWWLKPLFDRVPLYAISRAVFGRAPGVREIVRAQFRWGWRGILPWLLWRRLHPGRLLLLPVDLLEQVHGDQRRERVRVLTKGEAGPRNQIIMLGAEFEVVLALATILLLLMFVPTELLEDAATSLFHRLSEQPPTWAKLALNACVWFGTTLVEPFLVGAGFGLYLNRRVQLEAWDVEHAFRRIAARLTRAAQTVCVLLLLAGSVMHSSSAMAATTPCTAVVATPGAEATAHAACPGGANVAGASKPVTLPLLLGANYRTDGGAFDARLKRAHESLFRTERDWYWVSRDRTSPTSNAGSAPAWLRNLLEIVALAARYWLWILAALVLGFIAWHHDVWMSWLREPLVLDSASAINTERTETPVPLPDDIPAAVRTLWQRGEQRAALALLYRAAVQRLAEGLGVPLPPGATEGECLQRSRQLRDRRYAGLFARIVLCWQAAAYARRMPEPAALETLLDEWTTPAQGLA
jgi:hypothetical protein